METPDDKSTTSVSFFVPLLVPMIGSTSHAVLVEWKRRRKEYKKDVVVRCNHDPERVTKMTANIANSFSGSLLEVLCDLEWGIEKSDVTHNVAAEFKVALRMNLQESDVRERVVQFFRSSRKVIEERGWSEFFTDQEGLKLKCKLLVSSIEPQALREDIEAILAYQNRPARTDERALFKIIVEKALEHEREFQRRKRQRTGNRGGGQHDNLAEADRPRKKARNVRIDSTPTGPPPGTQPRGMVRPAKLPQHADPGQPTRKPEGGCLKCKGDHWLVRCPVATHEEKTTLLRQQHERRNREKAERKKAG